MSEPTLGGSTFDPVGFNKDYFDRHVQIADAIVMLAAATLFAERPGQWRDPCSIYDAMRAHILGLPTEATCPPSPPR